MAADTCTNIYERPMPNAAKKILSLPAGDDQILLGICGDGGLVGELAANLKVDGAPSADATIENVQAWAHAVAKAITQIATEAGMVENGKLDSHLLLGWRGKLWTLTHMMAIPHPDGIGAIGSGEGPAIGALDAFVSMAADGAIEDDPGKFVSLAAKIGVSRDRYSAEPVVVTVLPHPESKELAD